MSGEINAVPISEISSFSKIVRLDETLIAEKGKKERSKEKENKTSQEIRTEKENKSSHAPITTRIALPPDGAIYLHTLWHRFGWELFVLSGLFRNRRVSVPPLHINCKSRTISPPSPRVIHKAKTTKRLTQEGRWGRWVQEQALGTRFGSMALVKRQVHYMYMYLYYTFRNSSKCAPQSIYGCIYSPPIETSLLVTG